MDLSMRLVLQVLVLVCAARVGLAQHWSYGWLPGGKRSVGELEATFRMMDAGDAVVALPADTPLQQPPIPYEEGTEDAPSSRQQLALNRRVLTE